MIAMSTSSTIRRMADYEWETWKEDTEPYRSHREDGPALVIRNLMGQVVQEGWYYHGRMHRVGGGPDAVYYENGKRTKEITHLYTTREEPYKYLEEPYAHLTVGYFDSPPYRVEFESMVQENELFPLTFSLKHTVLYFDNPAHRISKETWVGYPEEKPDNDEDLPSLIEYHDNENHTVAVREWKRGDGHVRLFDSALPHRVEYGLDGAPTREIWYDEQGNQERENSPGGSMEGGICQPTRRSYATEHDLEICSRGLRTTRYNTPGYVDLMNSLKTICDEVETPPSPGYLATLRRALEKGLELNSFNVEVREAVSSREFAKSVKLRIPVAMDNLFVRYKNQQGFDAGGLRRQFVWGAMRQVREILFQPIEVALDIIGDVPPIQRFYISGKRSSELRRRLKIASSVPVKDIYSAAGRLYAHMLMNGLDTELPLSRAILHQMSHPGTSPDPLLYYLLDTNNSPLQNLTEDLDEYQMDLMETANRFYGQRQRLGAFLSGFRPAGIILQDSFASPMEIFHLTYRGTITRDDLRQFLQNKVSFQNLGSRGHLKDRIIDVLLDVKDYRQLMVWWSGQSNLDDRARYVIQVGPYDIPISHSCAYLIDFPLRYVQDPVDRTGIKNFQQEYIYHLTFHAI